MAVETHIPGSWQIQKAILFSTRIVCLTGPREVRKGLGTLSTMLRQPILFFFNQNWA